MDIGPFVRVAQDQERGGPSFAAAKQHVSAQAFNSLFYALSNGSSAPIRNETQIRAAPIRDETQTKAAPKKIGKVKVRCQQKYKDKVNLYRQNLTLYMITALVHFFEIFRASSEIC